MSEGVESGLGADPGGAPLVGVGVSWMGPSYPQFFSQKPSGLFSLGTFCSEK